jgi:hypothetical protein
MSIANSLRQNEYDVTFVLTVTTTSDCSVLRYHLIFADGYSSYNYKTKWATLGIENVVGTHGNISVSQVCPSRRLGSMSELQFHGGHSCLFAVSRDGRILSLPVHT